MTSSQTKANRKHRGMPVPVMLHMLHLIEFETHDDAILAGVARTLSQAIDELTALQRTALDVMHEMDGHMLMELPRTPAERRRLC
jgi:hypothetical protein